jgi:beta-propeller repeat-containing protein
MIALISFALTAFCQGSLTPQALHPDGPFFIANQGQLDQQIPFYLQSNRRNLYFQADGFHFLLPMAASDASNSVDATSAGPSSVDAATRAFLDEDELIEAQPRAYHRLSFEFVGANPSPQILGQSQLPGVIHSYVGPKSRHRTNIPTFAELRYVDVWPGIDVLFLGQADHLKFQFEVAPGADPSLIQMRVVGATNCVLQNGGAHIETPAGPVDDAAPIAWQIKLSDPGSASDSKSPILVQQKINAAPAGEFLLSFELGDYDSELPLIVDPESLLYSGYIGGTGTEEGRGIDVNSQGIIFATGYTDSADLPVKNPLQGLYGGGSLDVWVAAVNKTGELRYLTYLGGTGKELPYDLSIDNNGDVYVVGGTTSADFPAKIGPYLTHSGGSLDGFITKLNADGTLNYSGFLGGSQFDSIRGNYVDDTGAHYVIGRSFTDDGTFPTEVGPKLTHSGGISDVFVAKVNPAGDDILFAGFIGGDEIDYGREIIADDLGFVYVTGWTNSDESTFPAINGPDVTYNGGDQDWGMGWNQYGDAFVGKLFPDGSSFVWCGFIGGSGSDAGFGLALDGNRALYVAGHTTSDESSFPVKYGPDLTFNGGPPTEPYGDAWVGKIKPDGSGLEFAGYVGGDRVDRAWRLNRDNAGRLYLVGNTRSLPNTYDTKWVGPQLNPGGREEGLLAVVSPTGSQLLYASFFGGGDNEIIRDVTIDDKGFVYLVGWSDSTEASFPLIAGPGLTKPGGKDAFVARIPPYHYLLRAGNAIDPATSERKDLLFIDGQVGDTYERTIEIAAGSQVDLQIDAIGYDGNPLAESEFVLYLWHGEAVERIASHLVDPMGGEIGTSTFPTPMAVGSSLSKLTTLINTTRNQSLLGFPLWPDIKPAPYQLTIPLPDPGTYVLQALIQDPNKATGVSLSNAVVLIVK